MSKLNEKKLKKDLDKIGYNYNKRGSIYLCAACCRKYNSSMKGSSRKCVFGCN